MLSPSTRPWQTLLTYHSSVAHRIDLILRSRSTSSQKCRYLIRRITWWQKSLKLAGKLRGPLNWNQCRKMRLDGPACLRWLNGTWSFVIFCQNPNFLLIKQLWTLYQQPAKMLKSVQKLLQREDSLVEHYGDTMKKYLVTDASIFHSPMLERAIV